MGNCYKAELWSGCHFLAERLTVSLDYFREDRSDILSKPDYLPAILGMSLPSVNVGETLNRGFEVQLKWNETLKMISDIGQTLIFLSQGIKLFTRMR